jgi:predicted unusual protein kinase regulating ubiquinone biosynthesis (AarF/ABC1/UbiB family)
MLLAQVKKEFGVSVYEMFDDFDETPIASGSIAQVYKARLEGKDVAVKVRHPNVVEHIRSDDRYVLVKRNLCDAELVSDVLKKYNISIKKV